MRCATNLGGRIEPRLDHGDALDLHRIDLSAADPVPVPLTDDDVSCEPRF